jgi:hypothetical protein
MRKVSFCLRRCTRRHRHRFRRRRPIQQQSNEMQRYSRDAARKGWKKRHRNRIATKKKWKSDDEEKIAALKAALSGYVARLLVIANKYALCEKSGMNLLMKFARRKQQSRHIVADPVDLVKAQSFLQDMVKRTTVSAQRGRRPGNMDGRQDARRAIQRASNSYAVELHRLVSAGQEENSVVGGAGGGAASGDSPSSQ